MRALALYKPAPLHGAPFAAVEASQVSGMQSIYRVLLSLIRPSVLIAILPLVIGILWTAGPLLTETVYTYSGIVLDRQPGFIGVVGNIEPNIGITSFALGARAAFDVWAGHLPLWNPYQGLGAPLLGEMQSAALFPLTWLLALPQGQAIAHALLQLVAGLGTYLFLRSLGLSRTAALTGAMLYEVNGVYAWLRNAIFNPVAFLPWLMLTVEHLRRHALDDNGRRIHVEHVCLGGAMGALALYAGFPEQVYLYTLLVGAWALFRFAGLTRAQILRFAANLVLVATLASALSAPVLTAFASYLPEAHLGRHDGEGFYGAFPHFGTVLQYILPYVFGPIFSDPDPRIAGGIWSSTGGYIGFSPIVLALGALCIPQHRALALFFLAWMILALGTSHGIPGLYEAFMALPLAKLTASFRYLNPSWIFAAICMAAIFIDQAPRLAPAAMSRALIVAVCGGLGITLIVALANIELVSDFWAARPHNRMWAGSAALAALCISLAFLLLPRWLSATNAIRAVCVLSIFELSLWFLIPYLGNPRSATLDNDALHFLRSNIGYQRVMSMPGVGIQPNYGSYFGIATLNYNDVPVPARTVDYIHRTLDPYADHVFDLSYPELPSDAQDRRLANFRAKMPMYAGAGIKYVLARPEFLRDFENDAPDAPKLVHSSRSMSIYELHGTKDYFTAAGCALEVETREKLVAACADQSVLTRLELFMPGWTASINGRGTAIEPDDGTFQSVRLPAGRSEIVFRYTPPYFYAAAWVAVLALGLVAAVAGRACARRAMS